MFWIALMYFVFGVIYGTIFVVVTKKQVKKKIIEELNSRIRMKDYLIRFHNKKSDWKRAEQANIEKEVLVSTIDMIKNGI